jgi:hypothetical protein
MAFTGKTHRVPIDKILIFRLLYFLYCGRYNAISSFQQEVDDISKAQGCIVVFNKTIASNKDGGDFFGKKLFNIPGSPLLPNHCLLCSCINLPNPICRQERY